MVNPPQGRPTATIALTVKNCVDAIAFYKKVFDAQELHRMVGPDGKSTIHAEIKIGDSVIMLGDESPQMGMMSPQSLGGSGSGVYLYVKDADETLTKAASNGAKITMPTFDGFWGDRMGAITDPFGHKWSIATHIKDMTPEEIAKAGQEFMKSMCK
ncbi:MAG: VOC family protein [Thaumarchaeota archaeon]|nr:VOC family protein [Nitrososphaerota archaeon]